MSASNTANRDDIDHCIKVMADPSLLEPTAYPNTVAEVVADTIGPHYSGGTSEGAIEDLQNEVAILREVVAALIIQMHGRASLNDDDLKAILGGGSYPMY